MRVAIFLFLDLFFTSWQAINLVLCWKANKKS